jgi:hypothetical protein
MITVLVTGGRNYRNEQRVYAVLDKLHAELGIAEVIHGACGWDADRPETMHEDRLRGADALADAWARGRRVRVTRVPAHWTTLGGGGGPQRNAQMIAMAPDVVVAFPGGPGTNGMKWMARKAGINVQEITP